ncbi:MAG: acetyltransferase [Desulfobulbus propionicus]|nr:MAG: acetyltransferase [Desulfobulbus propionicus]
MQYIDVFNGDADGICALHQLRLANPVPDPQLITGVKRDIRLLEQIDDAADTTITVLDISLAKNLAALTRLLSEAHSITYIDHHYCAEIPQAKTLHAHIDPDPQTCTSLIVDELLEGAHPCWALVGAFGDNLDDIATTKGNAIGLTPDQIETLREIGRLLNYNGYGFSLDDLHIPPADLFFEVHRYPDPFVMSNSSSMLKQLRQGYADDITNTVSLTPYEETEHGRIFILPDTPWSRRVVGDFSNQIAREQPDKAHATAILTDGDCYRISVRAPLQTRLGADTLCLQFPTGGGRAGAAGINALPIGQFETFLHRFSSHFSQPPHSITP